VKWFDPDKGFGFIQLSDGSGDAFLHSNVFAGSGIDVVRPGETVEVRIGPGHKGPHVTEVLSVDPSTAVSSPRRSGFSGATSNSPFDASVEQAGTVKWFNVEKGYGFIALAGGEDEIFVHASALERSGLTGLNQGQQVVIAIGEGRKGPQAVTVRLV
jgi:cold shock protein